MTNLVPPRYRSVSVATVAVPLTEPDLRRHFVGREAYRRTEYIVVHRDDATAVVRVEKAPVEADPLFSPIVSLQLVAAPDECVYVIDPLVDTAVPTQLARAAAAVAGARCVVVRGRYEHVNFILDPAPLTVAVVEVVPPCPAKLVDQIERVLQTAESLPPIVVEPHLVDLVADRGAGRWLFPCRGGGAAPRGGSVAYLDERPPREDWTLVGCARSREIHRWFYGDVPPCVESCPRVLAGEAGRPTIVKCCLNETGIVVEGLLVTVPWGASLDEIRRGLHAVVEAADAAAKGSQWAPA